MASGVTNILLYGGSRSTKTFTIVNAIIGRAIKAPGSRHAIFRHRFNHVKASIVYDTFPKVMQLRYPGVKAHLDKTDMIARYPNNSEIWFGGLDEKDRTEKVLGNEFASMFLNEASQIKYSAYLIAKTRLAQRVMEKHPDGERWQKLKMYIDENPPSDAHFTHKLFIDGKDPDTGRSLADKANYGYLQMNPRDNVENLPPEYLAMLENMPPRMRKRFWEGEFANTEENALWRDELIDRYRIIDDPLPDMQRIIISVDPSGAGDNDMNVHDAIGIIVAGLGTDGHAYVLEDLTVLAGPSTWGKVATNAFDRHEADLVVAETNYGGAMVKQVIRVARPNTPFKALTASRGKVVRAEPISALYEDGKVHHVGYFPDLEGELCGFTTNGYIGERSPNRADALVWSISELFPGLTRKEKDKPKRKHREPYVGESGWMAA